jgi:hypothetical protein
MDFSQPLFLFHNLNKYNDANTHQHISGLRVAESRIQQKRAGPYVIRQDGIPPGSLEAQEDRFLLRKDGIWVLNITVYTLSEKEQEQFIFQDAAELYATVEKLYGKPVVEAALPPGKSRVELLAAINTTIFKVWSRMRAARATRSVMITPKYRCAVKRGAGTTMFSS